jgi:hypothetical protein
MSPQSVGSGELVALLAYWNEHAAGGHFPAMEAPDALVGDLRTFFASLR